MYLSDQELQELTAKPVRMPRPRLTCPEHIWGQWMRDVITIRTPDGNKYAMAPDTHYRRFCTRKGCKGEQKGRGTAGGGNIKAVENV